MYWEVQTFRDGEWRQASLPDTLSTAVAHARRQTGKALDHPPARVLEDREKEIARWEWDRDSRRARKVK